MANELDEFEIGYNGPGTGADEWMIAPEVCRGLRLKGAQSESSTIS